MSARSQGPWYRVSRDIWCVTIGGKQITVAKGKANKKAAIQRYHELMADAPVEAMRTASSTPGMHVTELADLWVTDLEASGLAVDTLIRCKRCARGFLASVGSATLVSAIKPHHLTRYINAHPGWSDNTKATHATTIKSMFAWGKRQGYMDANTLMDFRPPKRVSRGIILSPEGEAELLEGIESPEFLSLLTICQLTGMRPSEAYALEARHIDWTKGQAIFEKSKTSRKTGRARIVYLTKQAIEMLRPLAKKFPSGPLLRNTLGGRWNRGAVHARMRRLRSRLGLGKEATIESFRHGFITSALERGVPIATVSALAGHVDTTMVSRVYSKLHQREEHLAEAAELATTPQKKKAPPHR